jgi:hypothetical protein
MSYYSYIDTALRVIHINRSNEGGDERTEKLNEMLRSLKASKEFQGELILENIKYNLQSAELNLLMVHESHHYWQSLFYPYLFYINFLEFHTLSLMRLQLERFPDEKIKLGTLRLEPKIAHNLQYCSDKFRYRWKDDGQLDVDTRDLNAYSKYESNIFSLNDLIEDATTIFQYKATQPDASAENYFRWIQNPVNRGYKKLYKFLVRRFDKAYAYHFIPILVQLAFHTTEPVSMFMNLVNLTIYHGFWRDLSPSDYGLIKIFFMEYVKPISFSVAETLSINDMPVGWITPEFHREIVEYAYSNPTSVHYPLSVHAKKHLDRLAEDPTVEEALIGVDTKSVDKLLAQYFPFAIHFNFLDQEARHTALITGSDDYQHIDINGQTVDYDYIIKEQLSMQDTTINLFFDIHRYT